MSQQSTIKRPRTKLWQFSLANLLVAITLIAVTCGAFRFDIILGVGILHLSVAIVIAAVRTRAAVGHQEELWDALDLPHFVRRSEAINFCITSFGVALVALFLFHVGFWIAITLIVIAIGFVQRLIFPYSVWIMVAIVLGSGLLLSAWWLRLTWPRPYFTRAASPSSPSAEAG